MLHSTSAFDILIIEDCEGTRGILSRLLREETESAAAAHSLPLWPALGDNRFKIEVIEQKVLDGLRAARSTKGVGHLLAKHFEQHPVPHVLVLDLALNGKEAKALDDAGGKEIGGRRDPRKALEKTTGFRILQEWDGRCPVLVTTFAKNPHVLRSCWDAGACDVIVKPLTDKQMLKYYDDFGKGEDEAGEDAFNDAARRIARIATYVHSVAHEVLKTVRNELLEGLLGVVPPHMPFWLVADDARVKSGLLDKTNLMLVDVRGFSKMVETGNSAPEAVHDILNAIWAAVVATINDHDGEVNNFIGDAALIFRGVYGEVRKHAKICDTLKCAREISELCEPGRPLRERLIEIVDSKYSELKNTEDKSREQMLDLIGGSRFGVRVVSIEPDGGEAWYGKVGTDHRWQHTIVSRFMNFLARGESAIGDWEKMNEYKRVAGESFLLWRKDRNDPPVTPGFLFQLPPEYLGKSQPSIRDLSEHVAIYRVLPSDEGAPAQQ